MGRKAHPVLLVLFVILTLSLIYCCAPRYEPATYKRDGGAIMVRFVYPDDGASTVCVSGNFNSWSEQNNCLSRSGDTWFTGVTLLPGRYQYLFLVDGRNWREDPGAELSEDSGFGTKNSVLIVE